MAFTPDNCFMLARHNTQIRTFDLTTKQLLTCIDNTEKIISISFSPNGEYFVVGCPNLIKIYNMKDHCLIFEAKAQCYEALENYVTYKYLPVWSACGNYVLSKWNKKV